MEHFWLVCSPTDTVATATGDSFIVANPGQLTWYLGYEEPTYYLQTNLAPNNGLSSNGSGVAFSITPAEKHAYYGFDYYLCYCWKFGNCLGILFSKYHFNGNPGIVQIGYMSIR